MKKIGVAVGLVMLLLVVLAGRSKPPEAAVHPLLVEAVPVQSMAVRSAEHISGQAEPVRTATLASEVAGRVLERRVRQGDRVAANQVLAIIDPATAQTEVDQAAAVAAKAWAACREAEADYQRAVVDTQVACRQAQAQLDTARAADDKLRNGVRPQELETAEAGLRQAQADQSLAERDAARYRQLLQEGAISSQMWDQANNRLLTAQARCRQAEESLSLAREGARREDRLTTHAQVESAAAAVQSAGTRDLRLATLRDQIDGLRASAVQADAAVREARLALNRHRLHAPFAGRILATPVESGELVSPGMPVVRLGDVREIKAAFAVPERTRVGLRLGMPVTVSYDGGKLAGRVTTLGFQADLKTRTFPIEVTLDNPRESVLPGMILQFEVPTATAYRLVVPLGSIATDGANAYVYVVDRGRAERRSLQLGSLVGSNVVVVDGLVEGETVAANPQRLSDGVEVKR